MRQKLSAYGVVLALIGYGCSTGFLGRLDPADDLPADLPDELKQKFEIQDVTPAESPQPLPVPIAEPTISEVKQSAPKDQSPASPVKSVKKTASDKAGKAAKTPKRVAEDSAEAEKFFYPVRRTKNFPIWVGEQQVYEITYFGMLAGTLTLDVLPHKYINERKVHSVRGRAVSSKVFGLFYRLDDVIESFIDYEGLFSHRFHLILNETKQTRDALELYDNEKLETYYWNRWNHKDRGYKETKKFYPIGAKFPQDSLSALYYLRTLPLKDGKIYRFPVVSEGKTWEAEAHVVRREKMNTPMGLVDTVVVRPVTKFNGVIKQKGDSFIWMTDDDRRIIVRLEAKVKIGTITAELVSAVPGSRSEEESAQGRGPGKRGGVTR